MTKFKQEPTSEDFSPTELLRNLNPGDTPAIVDLKHYKVIESTRVREKKASGSRFNILRNEAAGILTITCIERPLFYSPHGITIRAKYIGRNARPSDEDEVHILRVYTGDETLFSHKQDGTFSRQYDSFSDFLKAWIIIDPE